MTPWGLVGGILFLGVVSIEAATENAEGKSVVVRIESAVKMDAMRVAAASVAAVDLFDELTQTGLAKPLEIRGQLGSDGPAVPLLHWESARRCRISGDPQSVDFPAAWVAAVLCARIGTAAEKRGGSGSFRWVAEGCAGKAVPEDEAMRARVAAQLARTEEAGLGEIQSWPEGGRLANDSLTCEARRLLASRLFSRAISSANRIRLQEWVAVGCPGKFWSDSREEDEAWRRSLAEPDLRNGTTPQTPEETLAKLRNLAAQVAKAGVRGNTPMEALSTELVKLEATADPFLRPAIFRYRQAVKLNMAEDDAQAQAAALQEADDAVDRWREMRTRANQLLDWYELNVPDARLGPGLWQWEKGLELPQEKGGRPTGFEPATARTTIWSSTN